MPDEKAPQSAPAPQPAKSRPDPPPFRPNKDLIGYIEKGQKPPVRSAPLSEKQCHRDRDGFGPHRECTGSETRGPRSISWPEAARLCRPELQTLKIWSNGAQFLEHPVACSGPSAPRRHYAESCSKSNVWTKSKRLLRTTRRC